MSDLGGGVIGLSALELAHLVRSGQASAPEVTEAYLRRIDGRVAGRAFITVCHDYALRRSAARPTGPLAGVPMAVKDMFRTAGIRTTYGSAIFRDYVPRRTATAVRVLASAGAILMGKATQHELAPPGG